MITTGPYDYSRRSKIHDINLLQIRLFCFIELSHVENLDIQGIMSGFFCLKIVWAVAKLWWFKIKSSLTHSRQNPINLFQYVQEEEECPILYRTGWYFPSSLFIKIIESFHNLPNFTCIFLCSHWRYWLDLFHHWKEENLLYPFSLHDIFMNSFFLVKIWCSLLFDVLQYYQEALRIAMLIYTWTNLLQLSPITWIIQLHGVIFNSELYDVTVSTFLPSFTDRATL